MVLRSWRLRSWNRRGQGHNGSLPKATKCRDAAGGGGCGARWCDVRKRKERKRPLQLVFLKGRDTYAGSREQRKRGKRLGENGQNGNKGRMERK